MGTDADKGRGKGRQPVGAVALVVACLSGAAAPSAPASSTQLTIVRDDRQLLERGADVRDTTLAEMKAQGVDVVQVFLHWDDVAPSPEAGSVPWFDQTDPTQYEQARFQALDGAVRRATAMGFRVMINPVGPVPLWASADQANAEYRDLYPDPAKWARFVRAVARRYDGTFDPGDGAGPVPAVRWWGVWNEPNFSGWLQPQWERKAGRTLPRSPHLYRDLYQRAVKQIRKERIRGARFFIGDTSPSGREDRTSHSPMYPLRWWREFFCLSGRNRPLTGAARRVRGCPTRFQKITANAITHHPFTNGSIDSPFRRAQSKLDLTIAQTRSLVRALDAASRAGRLRSKAPIYFTEFGIQSGSGVGSSPEAPPRGDASLAIQAQYINEAEYIGYRDSRVRGYSQYPWMDDPESQERGRPRGFQSGLYHSDFATKKPAYDAFTLPIFVKTRSCDEVIVWGKTRPRGGSGEVQIQAGSGSAFETVATVAPSAASLRYFETNVSLSGACNKQWRLVWSGPLGDTITSRTATPTSNG